MQREGAQLGRRRGGRKLLEELPGVFILPGMFMLPAKLLGGRPLRGGCKVLRYGVRSAAGLAASVATVVEGVAAGVKVSPPVSWAVLSARSLFWRAYLSGLRFAAGPSLHLPGMVPDSLADCAAVGADAAVAIVAAVPGRTADRIWGHVRAIHHFYNRRKRVSGRRR